MAQLPISSEVALYLLRNTDDVAIYCKGYDSNCEDCEGECECYVELYPSDVLTDEGKWELGSDWHSFEIWTED